MAEIDLESPGKLTATAENAKDYLIYIVAAKAQYTPKAFQANPNCVSGGDLFFKSEVLPDKGGMASVDLAPKAADLKRKMKDAAVVKVKAVALSTARKGNEDENAKLAVIEPCEMKKTPPTIEIDVEDDKTAFPVGAKCALRFLIKGIDEVALRCEPDGAFTFPKTKLTKTEIIEITAAKAVKGTIFCSGTSIGGKKIEEKINLEAEGPSLKVAGVGYTEQGTEFKAEDDPAPKKAGK